MTADGYSERSGPGRSIHSTVMRSAEAVDGDWYATHPDSVEALLTVEQFSHRVLEPCVGGGEHS